MEVLRPNFIDQALDICTPMSIVYRPCSSIIKAKWKYHKGLHQSTSPPGFREPDGVFE